MRWPLCLVFVTACSTSEGDLLDAGVPDLGLPDLGFDAGPAADAEVMDAEACAPPEANEPGTVRTTAATLRGTSRGTTWAYLGVPYASPPIGELRFRRPIPPACEPTIKDTSDYGAICPQLDMNDAPLGDEDCLTLNVWTPATPPATPLPVLFFIHGGGQNQGSSSGGGGLIALYDGERLANQGNVVVTINYRLGALGFLTHPLLDGESGESSGNFGLYDQVRALEWVKENIAAFGGDSSRVMIFGESAGGVNVCLLYVSPLAVGLFQRALIESGGCVATPKATAVSAANRLLDGLGCSAAPDPLACARSKTPAEILAGLPPVVSGLSASDFQPTVDGAFLTEAPVLTLNAGRRNDVPLILGTNQNETYRMLPAPSQIATEAAYEQAARAFLTGNGVPVSKHAAVIALFPIADFGGDPHAALVALTTDLRWTCAGRSFLRAASMTASAPRFRYYFTHTLDPLAAPVAARAGAYHGIELPFVFGTIRAIPNYAPSSDDLQLSDQLQRYWSRFAATGDPNGAGDPSWPTYDVATDPYLQLDVPSVPSAGVRSAVCDALAAL